MSRNESSTPSVAPGRASAGRVTLRAALAVALLSAWLVLLFAGWVAGGVVHLLFLGALLLFPWRAAFATSAVHDEESP